MKKNNISVDDIRFAWDTLIDAGQAMVVARERILIAWEAAAPILKAICGTRR